MPIVELAFSNEDMHLLVDECSLANMSYVMQLPMYALSESQRGAEDQQMMYDMSRPWRPGAVKGAPLDLRAALGQCYAGCKSFLRFVMTQSSVLLKLTEPQCKTYQSFKVQYQQPFEKLPLLYSRVFCAHEQVMDCGYWRGTHLTKLQRCLASSYAVCM